ncbi:hypothetical protein A2U01_0047831 [Trifolium medium]|uniref:Uncharacterized protein n=1 Tax=Trifolium medium TaxID=97028 RepID=A0A392QS19_9FABA|nr:hypothetical protein [Trifolium medium]
MPYCNSRIHLLLKLQHNLLDGLAVPLSLLRQNHGKMVLMIVVSGMVSRATS